MLSAPDIATLLLVVGGLHVLMPMAMWLLLGRPAQSAPRLWCLGGVLSGVGLVLIGLRDQIPVLTGIVMGQLLLALGVLLCAQSLRTDLGRRWPWASLAVAGLVYAALLGLGLPWYRHPLYGVMVFAVNLLLMGVLVHSAWQVGRQENSRNARTIALVLGLLTLVIGSDLFGSVAQVTSGQALLNEPLRLSFTLFDLLVVLAVNMAYLGLALERAERQRLHAAREQARLQAWQTRREALVAFDRERLMAVLADSLGHAMMQPLSAASLRLEMAQRSLGSTQPDTTLMANALASMRADLDRVTETIERIRHWLRPSPGGNAPVDLVLRVQEVEQLVRQEARTRGVLLRWSVPTAALQVQGDGLQLAQALLQLVRNALQAAADSDPPEVQVNLRVEGSWAWLDVLDTGPGLPQTLLDCRTHDDGNVPVSLQGMGLFVVQSIVRQHEGRLHMRNRPEGGACVSLQLPLAPPATDA